MSVFVGKHVGINATFCLVVYSGDADADTDADADADTAVVIGAF